MRQHVTHLVAVLALCAWGCNSTEPQPEARLFLEVKEVGQEKVEVMVSVENGSGLFGAAFDLVYDAQRLSFESWRPGALMTSGSSAPTGAAALEDGKPGRVVAGIALEDPRMVIGKGTGTLMVVTFKKGEVASPLEGLHLEQAELRGAGNAPIAVTVQPSK